MDANERRRLQRKAKFLALLCATIAIMACAADPGALVGGDPGFELYRFHEQIPLPEAAAETAPELGEAATLADFLRYAALHNAGLEAAFESWKAALLKIPQVRALPDPRFTYAYFVENVETRVGPQRQKFALAQTFPWLEKLSLRADIAAQQAHGERARYKAARARLFYQVQKSYFEYYYLGRSLAVTRENLELLRFLETLGRTQYAAGLGGYADVMRVQVELGKLEDRLRSLEALQEPTVSRLNAALGRPPDAPIAWPRQLPDERLAATDAEVLAAVAGGNPEWKAAQFAVEKETKATALAGKDYYPDVTLGVEAIDTGPAAMGSPADSGKDPVALSVSLTIPVWFDKYRAGIAEAKARRVAAERNREDLSNRLAAEAKMALYGYRDAERKIELYGDSLLAKARQSLEVNLQGFEAGIGSYLAVIDAQRTLLEFELSLERARADRAERLAELDRLAGEPLPRHPEAAGAGNERKN